jgi:hypothetical protein
MDSAPSVRPSAPRLYFERGRVPNSPRRVLKWVAEGGAFAGPSAPVVAEAASVAGCSSEVVDILREYEADLERDPTLTVARVRRFLEMDRPRPCRRCRRDGAPVAEPCETCGRQGRDHAKSASKALRNALRCEACSMVFREKGRPERRYVAPARCNARCCPMCARRRLKRIIGGRWAPLFAALLADGYVVDFFTVGNAADHGAGVGIVTQREHVRDYLRRSGQALRALQEGRSTLGIEPGSVVAGLRVLELVPRTTRDGRPAGAFAHLHIILIRRAFVPYGLATKKLDELRARGARPAPEQLGIREVLRRRGLGEVGKHEVLSAAQAGEDRNGLAPYLWKVQRYIEKVEGRSTTGQTPMLFDGRHDIMTMLAGVRMVEPIGDARGLFGGPDRMVRELNGERCRPLELVGMYDPEDDSTWDTLGRVSDDKGREVLPPGVALEHGDELSVTRLTCYRLDTLAKWSTWADVPRLLADCVTDRPVRIAAPTPGRHAPDAPQGPPGGGADAGDMQSGNRGKRPKRARGGPQTQRS